MLSKLTSGHNKLPGIPENMKPFTLVLLALLILLLLCSIPLKGKIGLFDIKEVDMFMDVRADQGA